MPDLNIKGNIIDNFGTYLPTPIIDSVIILNDKIQINLSLFFNFTDLDITDAEIDNYLTTLSTLGGDEGGGTFGAPLYVWGAYILGQSYIDSILDKNNIDIMTELYGSTEAEFAHENTNTFGVSDHPNHAYSIFDLNSFERSDQNFYDNADNKIIQYGGSIEIPIEIGSKTLSITDLDKNIFLHPDYPIADTLQDMTVFAFTSWLTPGDPMAPPQIPHIVNEEDRQFTSLKIDLLPPLAEQQVSNISYTGVFKGGYADVDPKVHFIDENEVFYNKTPIQVIDGKYYKQDSYTLEQIVALFESYISNHKIAGEDNEDVKSVLDNIAYVLSVYGDTTQLLIELNKLRQTFPEKSSATEVGSMYAGFKTRFFGANEKVGAGTPVVEKLVRTSKIRDLRELDDTSIGYPTRDPQQLILATPSNGGLISSQVLFTQDDTHDGSEGSYYPPEPDAEAYVKNGFWFFNYEQALTRYANATGVLSLDTLYKYAGKDMVFANFKLTSATMNKWVYDPINPDTAIKESIENLDNSIPIPLDRLTKVATFKTDIEYNNDDITITNMVGPRSVNFVLTDEADSNTDLSDYRSLLTLEIGEHVHTEGEGGSTAPTSYISFLALRGVDAPSDTQVGQGYQLAAFSFQDVEESYSTAEQNEVYSFQVEITDTTTQMAQDMLMRFASYYENELTEYYDYASENCNYNNVDGAFNEFFTEAIMTHYKDLYASASNAKKEYPWVRGPIYYNLFRQVLTDFFEGDKEAIVADSEAISARINPINGTLENLIAFYENFGKFLSDVVDSSGMSITEYLADMPASTTHIFGGEHDVQYYPIPTPVPIVPELVAEIIYPQFPTVYDPPQPPECASTAGEWVTQQEHKMGSIYTSHDYDNTAGYVVFLIFDYKFTQGEPIDTDPIQYHPDEYRKLEKRMATQFVGWEDPTRSGYPKAKYAPIVAAVQAWVEEHDQLSGAESHDWISEKFYYADEWDLRSGAGACIDYKSMASSDHINEVTGYSLSGTDLAAVSQPVPYRVGDERIYCRMIENPPGSGGGSSNDAFVKCKQLIWEDNT